MGAEKAPVSMAIVGDYESSEGKQLLLSTLLSAEKVSSQVIDCSCVSLTLCYGNCWTISVFTYAYLIEASISIL